MKKFLFRIGFITSTLLISFMLLVFILKPVFLSNSTIFPYSLKPFDICKTYPETWYYTKILYIFFYGFSTIIVSNAIFNLIFGKVSFKDALHKTINSNELSLYIGDNSNNEKTYVNEIGLYQNFLITGTTGSGKTSSAIYPLTEQLIKYNLNKIGMLILDVKGNFHKKVKEFANMYDREDDLIIIEIGGHYKYNPLHKPNLKANVLANRLKTVLTLFSENNSDSYWLDKAEQVLCEAIKLCRLYNNYYVTFIEIHKLITDANYFKEKISSLKVKFQNNLLSKNETYDLFSSINFFENEFSNLDSRVLSILKSEITRITNTFISDLDVLDTFSPEISSLNFSGFQDVINNGKIVVLNINIASYQNLSKILATYLKLDFQTEVLETLANNNIKTTAFICDEYPQFCTTTDADFFAQSREAKCINIVSTQSYTSILNSLNNEYATKVIIQNLINKLWFRNDDSFTIEEIQKQIGKEDKIKISKNISENSKNINYSFLVNSFKTTEAGLSEGINSYQYSEYVYDTKFFTQNLETFSCLAFLSNGYEILNPCKLNLTPYFK